MPGAVVVDTRDGFTWAKDDLGIPLTPATARALADKFNADMDRERQTYQVYRLMPEILDTDCPGTGGPWGADTASSPVCPVCRCNPAALGARVSEWPSRTGGRYTGKVPQHGKH